MTALDSDHRADQRSDLSALTGVRSGKKSYYLEMMRTEERMTSAVRALEAISTALVRTRDDPRGLLREILLAAGGHLHADWTMIALRHGVLPELGLRFLAADQTGRVVDSDRALPASLRGELLCAGDGLDPHAAQSDWVRVPLELGGEVLGRLIVRVPGGDAIEHADLWVLRTLANQAAMCVHTASLYGTAADLRHSAQQLYDEIARSSQDLRTRTAELERAEGQLHLLHQREILDAERHRIALELHDSVAQYVLSAGLAVDVCRAEAADLGASQRAMTNRLADARDLIAQAGEQVRSVIYALDHVPDADEVVMLPDLLQDLAAQHRASLAVAVRIEGRPVALDPRCEHALARIAGEALFNVAIHADAARAIVRLRYTAAGVSLWISDDGHGDPRELRAKLRLSSACNGDGRHQGLANMAARADDLGGTFAIRRSKLGGVRLEVRVPLPGRDAEPSQGAVA